MTVLNDSAPFSQYIGDGVTTFFAYTFEIKDYSDVLVSVDTIPTSFVRGDTGVTITPAPAVDATVDIRRSTSVDQLSDFTAQEAFKAEKTEDAVDKLILLKQEAILNLGGMNLLSQPYLDNVTLVNDVGTDAVIPLWNVLAGVFSGEVNTVIPDAGDVVAKPEDFVYMQYGGDGQEQILTSTLYSIEAEDQIGFTIGLDTSYMTSIPIDEMDTVGTFQGGTLVSILNELDVVVDEMDTVGTFLGGTLVSILNDLPLKLDEMDTIATFEGGLLYQKLINGLAPDEQIDMTINIDVANCSMTPI